MAKPLHLPRPNVQLPSFKILQMVSRGINIVHTDVEHLYSVFETAKLYFGLSPDHVDPNPDDFKGFILMVAVKNKYKDTVKRLREDAISRVSSLDDNRFGSALAVASTLASQFIKRELSDGMC